MQFFPATEDLVVQRFSHACTSYHVKYSLRIELGTRIEAHAPLDCAVHVQDKMMSL